MQNLANCSKAFQSIAEKFPQLIFLRVLAILVSFAIGVYCQRV